MQFRLAQEFFRAGGGLGPDHPSYIDRAADHDLYSKLLEGECTCILDTRQMGKTSLKNAAKQRLATQGVLLLSADLALIGGRLAPDQWYCSLLQEFSRALETHQVYPAQSVRTFWLQNEDLAPAYRFMRGIEELLLKPALIAECRQDGPNGRPENDSGVKETSAARLILAIDEIDKVQDFEGNWSDDFFGAVRGFYENRSANPMHRRAGFLLIGVAPPSELTKGSNSTPFNIGHRIVLTDFTRAEASKLEKGFTLLGQSPARAGKLLDAVMAFTGGHPYLTQRLCYQAALMLAEHVQDRRFIRQFRPSRLAETACRRCFLDAGVGSNSADDNLRNVHLQLTKRLEDDRYVIAHLSERGAHHGPSEEKAALAATRDERKAAVLKLYARVLRGERVRDDFRSNPWILFLHFAGVVRSDHGRLKVRNRLYEEVFNRRWVQENLPGTFRRAEMAAFVRGIITASHFSLLLILVMSLGWLYSAQRRERQITAAETDLRMAQRAVEDPEHVPVALDWIQKAAQWPQNRHLLRKSLIDALSWDQMMPLKIPWPSAAPGGRAWDESNIEDLNLAAPGFPMQWVDYSADGRYVAAIQPDPTGCLLTVKGLNPVKDVIVRQPCCHAAVAFDPLGERFAFMSRDGLVKIIALGDGKTEKQLPGDSPAKQFSSYRLAFNPNPEKRRLAILSPPRNRILIWDLNADVSNSVVELVDTMVIRDLAWDFQGNQLAAIGEATSQVVIWNFALDSDNPLKRRFESSAHELESVCFMPDGRTLAGLGPDGFLFLWKTDGSLLSELKLDDAASRGRLVSSGDGTVGLVRSKPLQSWRFTPSMLLQTFPLPLKIDGEHFTFELDPAGQLLLISGGAGFAFMDLIQGTTVDTLPTQGKFLVHDAIFTPGSGDLLVCGEAGVLRWTHREAGPASEKARVFQYAEVLQRPRGITAVAISNDQAQLALAHPSPQFQGLHVDLLNMDNRSWAQLPDPVAWSDWLGHKLELTSDDPVSSIDKLSFSPDRRVLVGFSAEARRLLVWELNGGSDTNHPPTFVEVAFGYAFTPNSRWLVAIDRAVCRYWPLNDGRLGEPRQSQLPTPYRSKLGPPTAMVAVTADQFLLAQPTPSHAVELLSLKVSGKGSDAVEKLTELSLPLGTKIKALQLSQDASVLAALTEYQGNYSVRVWDLNQMNRVLQAQIHSSPLFVSQRPRSGRTNGLKVRFEPKYFPFLERLFRFEELEVSLRALRGSSQSLLDPGAGSTPASRALLANIAKAAGSLGRSDWHNYFFGGSQGDLKPPPPR